jgi:hypothetical protein
VTGILSGHALRCRCSMDLRKSITVLNTLWNQALTDTKDFLLVLFWSC